MTNWFTEKVEFEDLGIQVVQQLSPYAQGLC
jgi:hypothetical protein